MRISKGSLGYIVNKLKAGQHFSFARYGDGEWKAIRGKKGCNCDKHEYFPEMGKRLKQTIEKPINDPNYIYGWQTQSEILKQGDTQDTIRRYLSGAVLYVADVFHLASEAGELYPLIEQLRNMKLSIIGPKRLVNTIPFPIMCTAEVPDKNCYESIESIKLKILDCHCRYQKDIVYCFSASMATEILMYDLWPILGKNNWMIDFGSLWEPYIGNINRHYHERMSRETINKNLGVK